MRDITPRPACKKTPGDESPEGFIFDDSGLPDELQFLGNLSISGQYDTPMLIGADLGRQEYGRVPLSAIATARYFYLPADVIGSVGNSLTSVATKKILAPVTGTASAYPTAGTISFGYNESTSSLTVFVKNAVGNTLSGQIVVGPLQSATAWTNILGPVK